ncbi:ribonuclease H-like domain-containing protein [Trametes meyenii]|nr:ribonuclease H-like domain-containing protein [Trametes meyenii]
MMARLKPSFYAVAKGRQPGIFTEWAHCKTQILNYNGAKYKKFLTLPEAEAWIAHNSGPDIARAAMQGYLSRHPLVSETTVNDTPISKDVESESLNPPIPLPTTAPRISSPSSVLIRPIEHRPSETTDSPVPQPPVSAPVGPPNGKSWVVYSDGSCRGNGRPGSVAGIGVWWGTNHKWNLAERCPGNQTNNRAELIAIVRVLETAPKDKYPLVIKTDSQYSIGCFREWIATWKRNGWRTANGGTVANVSLIKYTDALLEERREVVKQPVEFVKVRGHSGDEGNDGADLLANQGAIMPEVPERDWDGFTRQVLARISQSPPPTRTTRANVVATPYAKEIITAASSNASPTPVVLRSQGQPLPASLPTGTDGGTGKDAESQARNVPILAVPLQSAKYTPTAEAIAPRISEEACVPVEDSVFGNPNEELSLEELNAYAECWLPDEEFLCEARDSGVS